jgi:ureidoacrylate peracid hydrolase
MGSKTNKGKTETHQSGPDGAKGHLLRMLAARPDAFAIDVSHTAVLVVDMQNDFAAKGGMFDRAGIDLSGIRKTISPIAQVVGCGRAVGMPIVYIKAGYLPDLSDLGAPGTPNRERHLLYGVGQTIETPDGAKGRMLIRDTWNTDVIPELEPQPGDVVIYKHRYSAFYETELDRVLKQLGVTTLIFAGCTTSVCLESTLRDAFFRDYSCILLTDCTAEPLGLHAAGYKVGPASTGASLAGGTNYQATVLLVQMVFGWVSDSEAFTKTFAMEGVSATVSSNA